MYFGYKGVKFRLNDRFPGSCCHDACVPQLKIHLEHHLLRHSWGEAHSVVRTRQQPVKVRLSVQKAKVDLQKVLNVPNVLEDPQQSVVVHLCHLQRRRHPTV